MRRREALAGALAVAALGPPSAASQPARVVALEWSIVSILLSLGIVPVGMPEIEAYRRWVIEPAIPAGVADVGIKTEPNLEAVAALRPDLILVSPLSRPIAARLGTLAPVREVAIYTDERAPVRLATERLRELGTLFGRESTAERLVADSEEAFRRAREGVSGRTDRPILMASLLDSQHVRVSGRGSLFDDVLRRLGQTNAWTGTTNVWGFVLSGIADLAAYPEARLLALEPTPPGVAASLARQGLWSSLPAVRAGRVGTVPAAWHYGDLAAAARFARSLPPILRDMA